MDFSAITNVTACDSSGPGGFGVPISFRCWRAHHCIASHHEVSADTCQHFIGNWDSQGCLHPTVGLIDRVIRETRLVIVILCIFRYIWSLDVMRF